MSWLDEPAVLGESWAAFRELHRLGVVRVDVHQDQAYSARRGWQDLFKSDRRVMTREMLRNVTTYRSALTHGVAIDVAGDEVDPATLPTLLADVRRGRS